MVEIFLTRDDLTTKEIIKRVIAAVVAGAFACLLFESGIGVFRKFMQAKVGQSEFIKDVATINDDRDEKIIFQTSANDLKTWEAVGSKLYLTNKRLIFKSQRMNIQKQELMILRADI